MSCLFFICFFCLWDRTFHWPRTHHIGAAGSCPVNSEDPHASAFPGLGWPVCATTPQHFPFLWVLGLLLGACACKTSTFLTKPFISPAKGRDLRWRVVYKGLRKHTSSFKVFSFLFMFKPLQERVPGSHLKREGSRVTQFSVARHLREVSMQKAWQAGWPPGWEIICSTSTITWVQNHLVRWTVLASQGVSQNHTLDSQQVFAVSDFWRCVK